MQHGQDFPLQFNVKIDKQITYWDYIHPGVRRVRHQVMHGENDMFSYIFLNLIRGLNPAEEPLQSLRADILGNGGRI